MGVNCVAYNSNGCKVLVDDGEKTTTYSDFSDYRRIRKAIIPLGIFEYFPEFQSISVCEKKHPFFSTLDTHPKLNLQKERYTTFSAVIHVVLGPANQRGYYFFREGDKAMLSDYLKQEYKINIGDDLCILDEDTVGEILENIKYFQTTIVRVTERTLQMLCAVKALNIDIRYEDTPNRFLPLHLREYISDQAIIPV